MSKCYVLSVDQMITVTTESESQAKEEAKEKFIELLQRGEANIIITEVWDDE